jgi:transposase InsO family protein
VKDVEEYIQRCESCAKMKGGRTPVAPLGELPATTGPMQMMSIDICGPYPVTNRHNRYLLKFIDHFSRYPEAIAIASQEMETVARALVTQVFTRHGCPQVLSSDRGTNFMSALFQEMCKLLQIKEINSTAFNPKIQGKV